MQIRLTEEHEQAPPGFICPTHGCGLAFEDGDEDGSVYVCPVLDCTTARYDGLSRTEILRREQGMGGF